MKQRRYLKLLSLVMALALIMSVFAGCGSNDEEETEDEEEETAEEVTETTVTEEDDDEEEEETEAEAEEEVSEDGNYEYTLPLTTEEVIYTATAPVNPNAITYFSDMNENLTWQEIEERTGVTIEFTSIAGNVIGEQYSILITSGDYPDAMCNLSTNYTGGATQALEDGVIIDLADYSDVMPNFWAFITQDEETFLSVKTDEGNVLIIPNCYDGGNASSNGICFRSDWFEELGLEVPETYDDYYEVLTALYVEYGGGLWLMPCGDARYGEWSAGFGVSSFFASSPTTYYPLMVKDGQVYWGTAMDEYKEYIAMMAQWYDEGLIMEDFYSMSGWTITTDDLAQGGVSAFPTFAESVESQLTIAEEQGYEFVAARFPVMNEGDTHHISGDYGKTVRTNTTWCFTTNSDDIELLLQVFDYRFSDEGALLCNYGVEGITFEYDDDGNPQYTDLIVNNEDGLSTQITQSIYLSDVAAYPVISKAFDSSTYSDWTLDARDNVWVGNKDNEYALPDSVSLTTDETEIVSDLLGDLMTLMEENVVKFITGALDVESDWDTFLQQQEDMGVRTVEEIYQAAYERYLAR